MISFHTRRSAEHTPRYTRLRFSVAACSLLAALAVPAGGQARQTEDGFSWSGSIPSGRWIRVRNLNGSVIVERSRSGKVEVTAVKTWRRGDPSYVRFVTRPSGPNDEDVLICALWGERSDCDESGIHTRGDGNGRNNDVSVEFHVLVPDGVRVGAYTVNGDVLVDGATSEVDAGTINGAVDVASGGGRVNASNVNGSVRARLGRLNPEGRMSFETVNGNIIVEFSGDEGADVEMQTVNGSLNTNFPMTLSGRIDPKRIRAHIGRPGGPRLRLQTVNGNVELKKR